MYLRSKEVKGEKYYYLVQSVWDSKRNTSRQETIKYLGKSSQFTINDIPPDHRTDPKIISFLASDEMLSSRQQEKQIYKLRRRLYSHLTRGDFGMSKKIYDDYCAISGFANFFEKILTPVMYQVGEMWRKDKISIGGEHVASNLANMLIKIIQEKNSKPTTKKKIVICSPEGEQHNLGANILETYLSSLGFRVYNLTPSEPHDSIMHFVKNTKTDVVLVSVTLPDNVKPAQRLVKKISQNSNAKIFVGGQAVTKDAKFYDAQALQTDLKNLSRIINSSKN